MPPLPSVSVVDVALRNHIRNSSAKSLLAYVSKTGFAAHSLLGNSLIQTLIEVRDLNHAQNVFDSIVHRRTLNSWNSLIRGYLKIGNLQHALILCHNMQRIDHLYPDGHTFVALLNSCIQCRDIYAGTELHAEICRTELIDTDVFVGTSLVDMYAKCGCLDKSEEVLSKLPIKDVFSWTALLVGYTEHDCSGKALAFFKRMQSEGVDPDAVILTCILKACSSLRDIEMGQELHSRIVTKGLDDIIPVGNTLVDLYAKCGYLQEALHVLDSLGAQDQVTWTALISGYVQHGYGAEALNCYLRMQREGIPTDDITYVCSLKACSSIVDTDFGQEIHIDVIKKGFDVDIVVGSSLVDMYAKSGFFLEAIIVFYKLDKRTPVAWTALITGYSEYGHSHEALDCFEEMQYDGIPPDAITYVCSLKACSALRTICKGQQLHLEIAKTGYDTDLLVGNTLVDMYANWGSLPESMKVFSMISNKDIVSWNARISGYSETEQAEEALYCFEEMKLDGLCADDFTYVCSLKASGKVGLICKTQEMHADILKKGLVCQVIANALIDTYSKFGLVEEAHVVFDEISSQDEFSWNALISGYSLLGQWNKVLNTFNQMILKGITPNQVTSMSVLTACSHSGLLDEGHCYFVAMNEGHGVIPSVEHCACIIDLIGRAGNVEKAILIMKNMPHPPSIVTWQTVLGACQKWVDLDLGREVFDQALLINENNSALYISMSNICMAGRD